MDNVILRVFKTIADNNVVASAGHFLAQWLDNIDFIKHECFRENGFDAINFPLTANHYGPWAFLPRSPKGYKLLRGKRRIMNPQEIYNILRTTPALAATCLGGIPGPRNREEALVAFGGDERAVDAYNRPSWARKV